MAPLKMRPPVLMRSREVVSAGEMSAAVRTARTSTVPEATVAETDRSAREDAALIPSVNTGVAQLTVKVPLEKEAKVASWAAPARRT